LSRSCQAAARVKNAQISASSSGLNLTIIGPGGTDYRVVGFVSGNDITLSQPTPGNLTVDASGNQMTGIINGWDNAKITLHKQ